MKKQRSLRGDRLKNGRSGGARGSAGLWAFGRCGSQYAVHDGQGVDAAGPERTEKFAKTMRTRDVLLAHRWLWAAQDRDPRATLIVRRGWRGPWRACAPVLKVPELPARTCRQGDALRLLATVPGPALRARAWLRAAWLLACAGVDGAATRELLRRYEGFFPGVEVGVAWSLHRRMCERGRNCLRCLDLRSLTMDLVAGASVWTLPEAGGGRWPVGVHLFASGVQAVEPPRRWKQVARGNSIPHATPR